MKSQNKTQIKTLLKSFKEETKQLIKQSKKHIETGTPPAIVANFLSTGFEAINNRVIKALEELPK